jgi:hypothetical protein
LLGLLALAGALAGASEARHGRSAWPGQTRTPAPLRFRRASHCWRRGSRCLHHPNQELKQTLTATCEIRTLQSVSTSIHYTFFTLAYQRRIANPNHNLIESNPRKIGVPNSPAQIPSQMMTGDGRSAHQLLYSIWFLNTKDPSPSKRPVA